VLEDEERQIFVRREINTKENRKERVEREPSANDQTTAGRMRAGVRLHVRVTEIATCDLAMRQVFIRRTLEQRGRFQRRTDAATINDLSSRLRSFVLSSTLVLSSVRAP